MAYFKNAPFRKNDHNYSNLSHGDPVKNNSSEKRLNFSKKNLIKLARQKSSN
jgi:hypothetical protein